MDRSLCRGVSFHILAGVVFVSGLCSLAYQVVWLREFRLIFGGAAPAASAVLAVFMGGLGLGGLLLGRRVERAVHPGRWYAGIEAGITLATLASPLLMGLMRQAYMLTGGVQTLGLGVATLVQVMMTVVAIGPACFLMGGTLPAVLRVSQSDADPRRATTALIYGVNVAGAVCGAFFATFVMLQRFGNLKTLLMACVANAVIAGIAYVFLRDMRWDANAGEPDGADGKARKEKAAGKRKPEVPSPAAMKLPGWFGPGAAFASGFAFFVIELVWYRASIPLFGGSVYNFGLILAVALAGMGCGSLVYSQALRLREPSLGLFALVSALLALSIIVPFALGDRLAYGALLLNTFFQQRSFEGLVLGWGGICGVLVFLPAFFAGIQFPFLISLIGSGGREIGVQVGRTYAWNTLGAVSGALLGGFVLIPGLSITGSWRFAAVVALGISAATLLLRMWSRVDSSGGRRSAVGAAICGSLTLVIALGAGGPSAYWLHHPIGYGRANALFGASEAMWLDYVAQVNRSLVDSRDGRETSVAVTNTADLAILSNGKSDSSTIGDSSTTVMSGLVGAILHPSQVKTACVVGFGTGITAGWMEQIETLEQLDVIELERVVVDLADHFRATNFDVIHSPKVRLLEGDAREILITSPKRYDLITSEPSNLHRAGVANLYTQEFYESVRARLNENGLFCQWVQTYETDADSVRLVIATLAEVFPKVELWQAGTGDLLLVCSREDRPWDMAGLRVRLAQEPYATAVRNLWGTTTLEGFVARAIANADFTRWVANQTHLKNRDDQNFLEFWFARNLGVSGVNVMDQLTREADVRGELVPKLATDADGLDDKQWVMEFLWKTVFFDEPHYLPRTRGGIREWPEEVRREAEFIAQLAKMSADAQTTKWPLPVATETERLYRLSALANSGDNGFPDEVEAIRESWPSEYHVLRAEHAAARGEAMAALEAYFEAVEKARTHPIIREGYHRVIWPGIERMVIQAEFTSVAQLVRYFEAASKPVSFAGITDAQRRVMMSLAMPLPLEYRVRAAEAWGEYPQWNEQVLTFRRDTFKQAGHSEFARAEKDHQRWNQSAKRRALEVPSEP